MEETDHWKVPHDPRESRILSLRGESGVPDEQWRRRQIAVGRSRSAFRGRWRHCIRRRLFFSRGLKRLVITFAGFLVIRKVRRRRMISIGTRRMSDVS